MSEAHESFAVTKSKKTAPKVLENIPLPTVFMWIKVVKIILKSAVLLPLYFRYFFVYASYEISLLSRSPHRDLRQRYEASRRRAERSCANISSFKRRWLPLLSLFIYRRWWRCDVADKTFLILLFPPPHSREGRRESWEMCHRLILIYFTSLTSAILWRIDRSFFSCEKLCNVHGGCVCDTSW